jgi:hypothetical protein
MTTSFDIEEAIWKKLDGSSLKTEITGKIRKRERPSDSDKEDIVVNSLGATSSQLDQSIANVNIFVPDMTINENGVQEKVPDTARMKVLTDIAIALFKDVTDGDYHYNYQQQSVIEDPDSGDHFVNIRINFYSINLN